MSVSWHLEAQQEETFPGVYLKPLPLHQVCLYFPVVERLPLCPCLWAGRFPWLLNLVVSHDFSGLTGSFPGLPFREVWKLNFRNSKWHKSLHFQQKRWQFHCFHPDSRAPFSKCFLAFCRQDSRDKYWLLIALMKDHWIESKEKRILVLSWTQLTLALVSSYAIWRMWPCEF